MGPPATTGGTFVALSHGQWKGCLCGKAAPGSKAILKIEIACLLEITRQTGCFLVSAIRVFQDEG